MEITPIIKRNILFDRYTRTFHTEDTAYPPESLGTPLPLKPPITPPEDQVLLISRPTYAMNHFHTCFGHAYLDTSIPLLSILDEYDSACLERRGFQLFIFKELWSDIDTSSDVKEFFQRWESSTIDYDQGTYKGGYSIFHTVCSDVPILFEKGSFEKRYIKFSTLLYGGNDHHQRCIHNCHARYPGRRDAPPSASDEQILKWLERGKSAYARYFQLALKSPRRTLFLARKTTRAFHTQSLFTLAGILDTEHVYFEDIPFQDQIEAFHSADTVLAAHGSGLCHLIWCRPGTHLIEIFSTDDPRKPIFESLCTVLGLRYTRIECTDAKGESESQIEISPDCIKKIYDECSVALPCDV